MLENPWMSVCQCWGASWDLAYCTVEGQEAWGSLGRTQRPDSSPRSPRPRAGVISQVPVGRALGVRPHKAACGYWISRDVEHVRVGEKLNKKMSMFGNGCPERQGRGAEVQGQKPHCQFCQWGLWRVSHPQVRLSGNLGGEEGKSLGRRFQMGPWGLRDSQKWGLGVLTHPIHTSLTHSSTLYP